MSLRDCELYGRPYVWVEPGMTRPSHIVAWLKTNPHIKALMVAGNRESKAPGIGARVERSLRAVFRQLGR